MHLFRFCAHCTLWDSLTEHVLCMEKVRGHTSFCLGPWKALVSQHRHSQADRSTVWLRMKQLHMFISRASCFDKQRHHQVKNLQAQIDETKITHFVLAVKGKLEPQCILGLCREGR